MKSILITVLIETNTKFEIQLPCKTMIFSRFANERKVMINDYISFTSLRYRLLDFGEKI